MHNQQPSSYHDAEYCPGTLENSHCLFVQRQSKESSALLNKLCHTLDSDLEASNTSANSFCHLSVYELHSNEDFDHLCVRAVDALERLELCLWLL